MRLYLDHCCYNRPFDDQSIDRNRLEAEAVIAILKHVSRGDWTLVRSEAHEIELASLRDAERRKGVTALLELAGSTISVGKAEQDRTGELVSVGFSAMDALHIACAESSRCDVLLTTDDAILSRAARVSGELRVSVADPLWWLMEQVDHEQA